MSPLTIQVEHPKVKNDRRSIHPTDGREAIRETMEGLIKETGRNPNGGGFAFGDTQARELAAQLLVAYSTRQDELVAVVAELAARNAVSKARKSPGPYLWTCVRNAIDQPTADRNGSRGSSLAGGTSRTEMVKAVDAIERAALGNKIDPQRFDRGGIERLVVELGTHDLEALSALAWEVMEEGPGRFGERAETPWPYFVQCIRNRWKDREAVAQAVKRHDTLEGTPVALGDRVVYIPEAQFNGMASRSLGGDADNPMMRRMATRWAWLNGQLTSGECGAILDATD